MREWVRVRGSGSQRVRAPWAQPGCVCGAVTGSPQPPQADSPPSLLGAPGLRHSPVPHPMHTLARTPSPHPDPLWDTPRDTQRLTGLWPVTLALGCVHTASQMHILTPSGRAHTHSIPDTHAFMVTHSFQGGGDTGHTHRHSLPWMFTVTPGAHPGSQVDQERRAAPLVDLHRTELFAGSLRCSSRRLRVPCP